MPEGRVPHIFSLAIPLLIAVGCGSKPTAPPAGQDLHPADAQPQAAARATLDVAEQPLGLPALAGFDWRKRAGQPAFRLARKAEEAGDWATVVKTCGQALAADPGHLDAAWLLAVGYAKLGQLDRVLAPLAQAEAGDFGKWGPASLELPALQAFLATPTGDGWHRRVELDRARYTAALGRALIVSAAGDLYAVEVEAGRWHRLTRTQGQVIGALDVPAVHQIAYASRTKRNGKHELGLGVIDLARGKSSRPVSIGATGAMLVAYSAQEPVGFWFGSGPPRSPIWRQIDDDYRFHLQPMRTARPSGPWLEITAKAQVRLHALPPNITADWDDQSLASAIRIGTSNRVVSVPSPGLIDGNSAAWSPDRVHLAFVAQLDDHCTAGAVNTAVFVADAATGGAKELERAAGGIALQWLSERKLAIVGDHGVAIRSLDDGASPVAVPGATGLLGPRERPRCAPPDAPDAAPPSPEDRDDTAEPAAPAVDDGTARAPGGYTK